MKNLNSNTMLSSVSKIFGVTMIVGMLVFSVSCKKAEKGDTGPAGPAGTNGTNGTNGVANISTFTGTTTNASWTLVGTEYQASFNVSGINSDVVSNGAVMAYLGNTAQTSWQALPTSYQNYEVNYEYLLGTVKIYVTYGNGATPTNPGGLPFKFVVIPPAMKKPNVNINNYEEVASAYNL